MVHLSDDSSDVYQNPGDADETESDTEPDTEALDIEKDTESARRHGLQAGQQGNSGPMTVRISTTSGSQELSVVRRTPVVRGRITLGRAYSPPISPLLAQNDIRPCWPPIVPPRLAAKTRVH